MLYSFVSCVWCVALRGVFYPPPFLLPLALQELTTSRSLSVLFVGRGALHIKFHGVLRKIGRPATLFFCNHELISNLFSVISLFFSRRSLHSPASSWLRAQPSFSWRRLGKSMRQRGSQEVSLAMAGHTAQTQRGGPPRSPLLLLLLPPLPFTAAPSRVFMPLLSSPMYWLQ